MTFYSKSCEALKDSGPTVKLMKKVDNLISAMMSRTPVGALKIEENNAAYKVRSM